MNRKLEHIKDGSWILWSESIKACVFPFGLHSLSLRCQCTIPWLMKRVCLTDCVCVLKHWWLLYVFCVWTSSPVNMFVCILLSDQSFSQPSPSLSPHKHKTCIAAAFYSARWSCWSSPFLNKRNFDCKAGKNKKTFHWTVYPWQRKACVIAAGPSLWLFSTGLVLHSAKLIGSTLVVLARRAADSSLTGVLFALLWCFRFKVWSTSEPLEGLLLWSSCRMSLKLFDMRTTSSNAAAHVQSSDHRHQSALLK